MSSPWYLITVPNMKKIHPAIMEECSRMKWQIGPFPIFPEFRLGRVGNNKLLINIIFYLNRWQNWQRSWKLNKYAMTLNSHFSPAAPLLWFYTIDYTVQCILDPRHDPHLMWTAAAVPAFYHFPLRLSEVEEYRKGSSLFVSPSLYIPPWWLDVFSSYWLPWSGTMDPWCI